MLVGYMRVSSDNDRQTTALQHDALISAGVDARHLFGDKASGARDDRPGLKRCLDFLKAGDTLVVWKLDRLGRSLPHLLDIVAGLRDGGIAFRLLDQCAGARCCARAAWAAFLLLPRTNGLPHRLPF